MTQEHRALEHRKLEMQHGTLDRRKQNLKTPKHRKQNLKTQEHRILEQYEIEH